MKIFFLILLIFSLNKISMADSGNETGLEIPRYISLKTDNANIRIGPSKNYPIVIKFIQKNYPLKVIDEYYEWRKVEDFKKKTGWIHKSLISGKRTGIIMSYDNLAIRVLNTTDGKVIGLIGEGNIVLLNKCKIDWCHISFKNYKGWINKKNIWGIKQKEIFKINFLQILEDTYFKSINLLQQLNSEL